MLRPLRSFGPLLLSYLSLRDERVECVPSVLLLFLWVTVVNAALRFISDPISHLGGMGSFGHAVTEVALIKNGSCRFIPLNHTEANLIVVTE